RRLWRRDEGCGDRGPRRRSRRRGPQPRRGGFRLLLPSQRRPAGLDLHRRHARGQRGRCGRDRPPAHRDPHPTRGDAADPHQDGRQHLQESTGREGLGADRPRRLPRLAARRRDGVGKALQLPDQYRRRHRPRHRGARRAGAAARAGLVRHRARLGNPPRRRAGMSGRVKSVAVLMGGISVERQVSLRSGQEVAKALREKGYAVTAIDVPADVAGLVEALTPKPDAVFNALHGRPGEDGSIQGLLDLLRIPYTHSGLLASALAMDKPFAKKLFESAGLRCPEGRVVRREEILAGDVLPRPYVIKPPAEGSSFGVHLVQAGDNKQPFANDPWPYGDEVLVERFIPGRELTVAVRGEGDHAQAMGAIEIRYGTSFF